MVGRPGAAQFVQLFGVTGRVTDTAARAIAVRNELFNARLLTAHFLMNV